MTGKHAAPRGRRRDRDEDRDDEQRDEDTIAWLAWLNWPSQFVRQSVAPFLTTERRRSLDAAIRMTELIRRYAKAGAK